MQSEATITFTQPGVQPPVFVVTSLSTPPWATLELKPREDKTPDGDLIFEQKFGNVTEGSYQYKIRIGEGHWVIDESKESATDEHGNRNNVVHVQPATVHATLDRPSAKDMLDRKDSSTDMGNMVPGPVPFVIVDKVEDTDQPEYGDVKPKSLPVSDSKRAADPEPDFEHTTPDSPLNIEPLESPVIPLVVVEKVDDQPTHGDDFGEDATKGQKLAHELRAADASPNEVILASDELDGRVPLFRHESFQDSELSLPEASTDTIEEESERSSTDRTSSGDIIHTPSAESQDDLQDHDELGHGPLLPHETGFTGPMKNKDDEYEEDEFDAAPLLPHETGFSLYQGRDVASKNSSLTKDRDQDEPEHYTHYSGHPDDDEDYGELNLAPTFSHEQIEREDTYGAPLLPHERGSAVESHSGSERSFSMSPTTYEGAFPVFGRDSDNPNEQYGASMRPSFFRTRTSSSTLPNKLPRSDAEDLDLHDPGLEVFPVGREQILEHVATIGHKLPEDETRGAPTSPQSSVLSQACSSVDLVPVKSYLSLASVREDEEEEEDEQDVADLESLGSPVIMSRTKARYAREPLSKIHTDDSKPLDFIPEDKRETSVESQDASSSRADGAKDSSQRLKGLSDIVASRATVKNTLTPPLTPKALEALGKENPTPALESELRKRKASHETDDRSVPTTPTEDSVAEKLDPTTSSHGWKGASIGISALVAVGAMCIYLAVLR